MTHPLAALAGTLSISITLLCWALLPGALTPAVPTDYSAYYEPVARNIAAGRGILLPNGQLATRYPPGYPLLLAGLFGLAGLLRLPEQALLAALALACMATTSACVYLLARSVARPLPALGAALLWASYPLALWLSAQPSSEMPFMAALFGGFTLLWSALRCGQTGWTRYGLAGLLAGLALLIRPIGVAALLGMLVACWLFAPPPTLRRLVLSAALLLGSLIALLPWQLYAYGQSGTLVLLGSNGVVSLRDGLTFAADAKGYRQASALPADVVDLMARMRARRAEMPTLGTTLAVAGQELRVSPWSGVKLLLIKAARAWYATDSGRHEGPTLLVQLLYLLPVAWGSYAAWRRGGAAARLAASSWLVALCLWGATLAALSIARYMVPAVGLLCALGACAWPEPMQKRGV